MCNDCYSNFPFTLPLPSFRPLSILALSLPLPLADLCICPSLAACLFGVDSPACLSIVIALAPAFYIKLECVELSTQSVSLSFPPLSLLPLASYAFVYLAYLLPVHGCNFWATKSLMQNACSTHDELVETLGRQLLFEKIYRATGGEGGEGISCFKTTPTFIIHIQTHSLELGS